MKSPSRKHLRAAEIAAFMDHVYAASELSDASLARALRIARHNLSGGASAPMEDGPTVRLRQNDKRSHGLYLSAGGDPAPAQTTFPVRTTRPPAEKASITRRSFANGAALSGGDGENNLSANSRQIPDDGLLKQAGGKAATAQSLSAYMLRCHPYCDVCAAPRPSVAIKWKYGPRHQQWPVAVCKEHSL